MKDNCRNLTQTAVKLKKYNNEVLLIIINLRIVVLITLKSN